ncbi:MAG: DUF86 domain-containing protein [Bacillota bacterium]|nr:DUF86 domain-containing protein [Bacillota bacterium]
MKSKRVYTDYLRDMIEYAGKAVQFMQGVAFNDFQGNDEKIFAVVRALEVIGEAARHIPRSLRDKYPQVPWRKIIGMRDKVVHDYFGVDLEVVWRTVHEELPKMQKAVSQVLADMEAEEGRESPTG